MTQHSHQTAPTHFVEANGIRLAYRRAFKKLVGAPPATWRRQRRAATPAA